MTDRPLQEKTEYIESVSRFLEALTAYAIDPTAWTEVVTNYERLSDRVERWDPGTLMADLSRAEALSWRIRDGLRPDNKGFAYLLMDADGRVVASSSNSRQLVDYLSVDHEGHPLFTHPDSRMSLDDARRRLATGKQGHCLVSLSHPQRPCQRYGFLIARGDFPHALANMASDDVSQALFIAQDDAGSERLVQVIQTSFGLTTAEAELTLRLAQGLTLKQVSEDLHISVSTVRNHLQSVFQKSGINRQSDLVLVVTQLSVILAGAESGEDALRSNRPANPDRNFIVLPDGRRLAYRTYGNPAGRPVLFLHETVGCSRLPPGTDVLAGDRGLRLIALERPGFGFSDVHAGFTFDTVGTDMAALLDELGIGRCSLLGFISGAAYALHFANRHPQRVAHLMLVAGRPPQPMVGHYNHLVPLYTKMVSHPWVLTSFFNILRNRASARTNTQLITSVYGSVPYDRDLLRHRPEILEHMTASTLESITVTATGIAGDLCCFANSRPEAPSRLDMPITVWHGMADKLSDMEALEKYLAGIAASWRRFPEAGSLILYEHWADVLATLAEAEIPEAIHSG